MYNCATGYHNLAVNFLNDQCGDATTACTPASDRNVYVIAVLVDGVLQQNSFVQMLSGGIQNITIAVK
jgi:hypothetical protein